MHWMYFSFNVQKIVVYFDDVQCSFYLVEKAELGAIKISKMCKVYRRVAKLLYKSDRFFYYFILHLSET